MPVIIDTDEHEIIAHLSGEIDHHCAKEIRTDIDLAIEMHKPEKLILDFTGVTFMDSSGIGLVMGRYKTMKTLGGRVVIENPSAQIKKVMRLAGLDRLAVIK
jgi:stage II sporulation protein AA (anti-sigma F factor antagonist)